MQEARAADAVIVGSGVLTRDIVNDQSLMSELQFDLDAAESALRYVAPVAENDM